ncbi:penicillin acylase family protein [Aquirufa ecclesiirivi]|uniref:penicillin acylase family protein n=1 Tax=Aquirufa ecclesiirivi TaxID=2715124 RepID=UPI003BAF95F6
MRQFKSFFPLIVTLIWTYALHTNWGTLPPMGKLLSPFHGFWVNAEKADASEQTEETLQIPGLIEPVQVLYDEMAIPHVFAKNDHDLYLAQGYLTAKDRLWQMEFQTHFAGGRISEIVGSKGMVSDQFQRRMGAVYGAEQSLRGMVEDPVAKASLVAYSDGVNTYIESLTDRTLPLEYKLLNYLPEKWEPLKSALFLKNMSFVLASGTDDLKMTNILRKYGREVAEHLFPNYPFEESPIIPEGTPLDFKPLPIPTAPADFIGLGSTMKTPEKDPNTGSNNWAVAGNKTISGMPILANDPHLTLSLPSIWYQMQLVAPGINVYGSTMPGSPNVIAGFNKNIAWGVTNVGSDVMDWYQIKFKDASKKEYWHDGKWKKTSMRIERFKVRGEDDFVDTVFFTHHGPVVYLSHEKPFRSNIPVGHALKWIALEKSSEVSAFYQLNRAANYDEYKAAITHFSAPAQNFVFASNQGDIALWVNGKFPLKANLQGKYLLDGTDPAADWKGYIPHDHDPHVKNPPRGFVSSANQFSVDKSYPYYLGWQFAPSDRGRRINERLSVMNKATVDSLRGLQNDNFNIRARRLLPLLIPHVSNPNPQMAAALDVLKKWDLQNSKESIGATIFENWVILLQSSLWDDEFNADEKAPMNIPTVDRTLKLMIEEPGAIWWDNVTTKNKKESMSDIIRTSFQANIDSLTKQHGPMGADWVWYKHKQTGVRHLIPGMDALSRLNIPIGGGGSIVNASTTKTGPSWRLVVELSKSGNPDAYGVYPGGQSGNPGSTHYDDLIDTWAKGELRPLLFMNQADQKTNRIRKKMILTK